MKRICVLVTAAMLFMLCACGKTEVEQNTVSQMGSIPERTESMENTENTGAADIVENSGTGETKILENIAANFVLVPGGTFQMGSPETENWRSEDEVQHTVTVSDFYMSIYELTQAEYQEIMGENPSNFSGDDLPVENVTWLDAIRYCNARSEKEGLEPVYVIDAQTIHWNRGADGYRLPTEAEWEYACRAGTETPFNTETSISAEEANYYGHYPYEIEGNYFSQDNLTTKPGQYRQTSVAVDSFSPNAWGLYNMHGNVGEWVWDYYGEYGTEAVTDPAGAETGTLRVYRGGGWNDFAKNMRSAYRATMAADKGSFNIGIRLVRGILGGSESVTNTGVQSVTDGNGKVLIAFFSWGGNTRGIAEEIQSQTGADLFEIELVNPYSNDYNTVLDEAQRDQNEQARPELANHVENMEEYDIIILGYPNWWASIPMPIASFLEEYDFSEKTIISFCSHGGGRFGQSLTAISKLAPETKMGEALSVHYSGGSSLSGDVEEWLRTNGIIE
ncbi:MAG: SUMF1/EgtB/PvdO family nonheme iron enzyme [Lachnoclostridium sp.]|nr:SUMF1/EgtB/PvdO family nonheme iron enzyme [Lachnoclostridium sp.]